MFTWVLARALGCIHSHISTQTFRRALTASLDSCAEIKIECPFSGVTKSGRVWRKVPESDARSVQLALSFSTVSEIHASHRLSTEAVNIQQRTRHEALNTNFTQTKDYKYL